VALSVVAFGLVVGARPALADNPNPGLLHAALRSLPTDSGERTLSPYLFVQGGAKGLDRLPLKHVRAEVRIAGTVAEVVLIQRYANEGDETLEAIYLFPASTRAAVHDMRMWVGEREVQARIAKREEARKEYERAVQAGQTASLLEQQRPNVFQMSVGHVRAGDEVQIQLTYTELLLPTDGTYEFVLPQVVGPRYTEQLESEAGDDERWVANPYLAEGEPPSYGYEANVVLLSPVPVARVTSPSHEIEVDWAGEREAEVLLGSDPEPADFVLRYELQGEQIDEGLLLYPQGDGGWFLLTVQPPKRVEPERVLPHELIFVVDVSGSMNGFPADTSRELMTELLGGLGPADRFNLVLFAGSAQVLAERSLPADKESITRAEHMLDSHATGGGTRLLRALRRALALPRTEGMARSVVLITDGYVSVEREAFDLVRQRLGEANLFAYGIGSSVNRFLIEGLARVGQGEPFVAANPEQARRAGAKLRAYVAAPLLSGVTVEFEGLQTYDLEPTPLPDLFSRRPVVVLGRYRGEPTGVARVRGLSADGQVQQEIPLSEAVVSSEGGALRRLWARERIARLVDLQQLAPDDERVHQVTELGLQHSLVTPYTSFVAVDPLARPDDSERRTVRQPLPLPQGVSNAAVASRAQLGGGKAGAGILKMLGSSGDQGGAASAFGQIWGIGGGGGGGSGYGLGSAGVGRLGVRKERRVRASAVRGRPAQVMGHVSASAIRRVIRRHHKALRACFEAALKRNPKLQGKVVLKLEIGPDGTVVSASLDQCDIDDKRFKQDLLARVRRWRFPKPAGGGKIVVRYPLIFAASK